MAEMKALAALLFPVAALAGPVFEVQSDVAGSMTTLYDEHTALCDQWFDRETGKPSLRAVFTAPGAKPIEGCYIVKGAAVFINWQDFDRDKLPLQVLRRAKGT